MKPGVDYIGVGVGAMIQEKDGRILLMKRGENVRNEAGKWNLPGGAVHFGETLKGAIIREVKEELNVEIEVIQTFETIDHFIPEEKQHWVATIFVCRIVQGELKIMEPEKCSELRWVTIEEALKLPLTITAKKNLKL